MGCDSDRERVDQSDEPLVVQLLVPSVELTARRGLLGHLDDQVGHLTEPISSMPHLGQLPDQPVELHRPRIVQLGGLVDHELRDLLRPAGRDQDPAVAFTLDHRGRRADGAQLVEIGDHLGGQRQRVTGGQLGDPTTVLLQLADLRAQPAIDLGHRGGELLFVGLEQLLHPGQRDARLGQRPDPDQLDHGLGVVAAIPGGVPLRLGQEPDLVVVPDGALGHPRVRRQLSDRQHEAILRASRPRCG